MLEDVELRAEVGARRGNVRALQRFEQRAQLAEIDGAVAVEDVQIELLGEVDQGIEPQAGAEQPAAQVVDDPREVADAAALVELRHDVRENALDRCHVAALDVECQQADFTREPLRLQRVFAQSLLRLALQFLVQLRIRREGRHDRGHAA